jgi:hypothetical protein
MLQENLIASAVTTATATCDMNHCMESKLLESILTYFPSLAASLEKIDLSRFRLGY